MLALLPSILLVVVVGMGIAIQTQFAGTLGQQVGVMESVFIIHLGGLFVAGVYLLATRGGNLAAWRDAPWYALGGGIVGVLIVGGYSYAIPRIGLSPAITLGIASQLILSAVFSHYGLLDAIHQPMTPARIFGILILLLGTWIIVR
jgi:bacterial/archaeal transporter family-2 protein